ncbi:hypothetical protein Barb6_02384 [Bacteroidales bacterium Barb6]|nr:hypothetical protein Barb6_02384 [Bacteroidales bacterium Barb6]
MGGLITHPITVCGKMRPDIQISLYYNPVRIFGRKAVAILICPLPKMIPVGRVCPQRHFRAVFKIRIFVVAGSITH